MRVAMFLLAMVLAGCATGPDAMYQTVRAILPGDKSAADRTALDPNLRYLRVTMGGRVALLVLGYVEADSRGPIEVWYSGEREVLKLQEGRIAGALGTLTEWRNVMHSEMPQWGVLARSGREARAVRSRDVMPGYRYGVREELVYSAIAPPARTELRDIDPQSLVWIEERVVGAHTGASLPRPARYAVQVGASSGLNPSGGDDRATVIYAEQCLAPEHCFTWQRWPVGAARQR